LRGSDWTVVEKPIKHSRSIFNGGVDLRATVWMPDQGPA
jgi:hypothetical protein